LFYLWLLTVIQWSVCYFSVAINRIDKKVATADILNQLFEPFGQLLRFSYNGKTQAIAEYSTPDAAQLAILQMHGVQFGDLALEVNH
jgi:RNA recognition motif-containing protein